MALAKRGKTFVAIFALGLAALAVDRVFLRPQGGAEKASADAFAKYGVPASPAEKAASAPSEAQRPSVTQRLDRAWPDQEPNVAQARDPFSLTGPWLGSTETGPSAAPDPVTVFAKAHPLGAVVMNGPRSHVLVNDRFLTLGQQIDGFTLVSVGPKSATFERQGERIVLELAGK
jgi:hypothetical protein